METTFKTQSYDVKFDLGKVDISINVYHENQTQLSRKEIIDEAMGYADDANLDLKESDIYEIVTLEKY